MSIDIRSSICSFLVLVMVLPTLSFGSGALQDDTTSFLVLERVAPSTPVEFVTIRNIAPTDVDLNGLSLDDGEGWLRFNSSLVLGSGDRISITADIDGFMDMYPEERCLGYRSTDLIRHGTFALADKGDQVSLVSSIGAIVDGFVYGDAVPGIGWYGSPFSPMPKGDMAVRDISVPDTNSSVDWYRSCAGRSETTFSTIWASVEPFTAPEDSLQRIIREVGNAVSSIEACVYDLDHSSVVSSFLDARSRNVSITMLLEGQPVTGMSNQSKTAAKWLSEAGCDVRLVVSNQSYRRYDCVHAKYLIVDGMRVTVMSENWAGGLERNRGWGVTVTSSELALELGRLFDEDSSLERRDVRSSKDVLRDWFAVKAAYVTNNISGGPPAPLFLAEVGIIASPDNSLATTVDLIGSAYETVLVEQLYIDPGWVGKSPIMIALVEAAERGAKVRVLLDQTFVSTSDKRNNSMTVDLLNELASENDLDLEARLVSKYQGFGVMHNKGLIVDDTVVVSSMNWVDVSVLDNREVGLRIRSSAVSSFFASYFWSDWKVDPFPPEVRLPWESMNVTEGRSVLLDARQCRDNAGIASVLWTDRETGQVWNGSLVLAQLGSGVHHIRVDVNDIFNNTASKDVLVIVGPGEPTDGGSALDVLLAVPLGAGLLSYGIWAMLKRLKKG